MESASVASLPRRVPMKAIEAARLEIVRNDDNLSARNSFLFLDAHRRRHARLHGDNADAPIKNNNLNHVYYQ